jgi:hypothetical protein
MFEEKPPGQTTFFPLAVVLIPHTGITANETGKEVTWGLKGES